MPITISTANERAPDYTHSTIPKVSRLLLVLLAITSSSLALAAPQSWEKPLRDKLEAMAISLTETVKPWDVPARSLSVTDFGAVADGNTVNTEAIQKAIDTCSANGGGVVLFSGGDFVTGTIVLKSGVMLEVAKGSRLLGSLDLKDYPDHVPQRPTVMDTHMKMKQSLIYAENAERIGIRGKGVIDFRGLQKDFPGKQTIAETPGRPFGMRIIDCRRVVVQDITLKDSACWLQNYLNCEDLLVERVTVSNQANHNNDGIDIDGCRRVIIRECYFNSEDDCMCIKGASLRPTEDVLIENSVFVSTCNALKIGTDTQGDFRRIYVRNVQLGGIPAELYTSKGRTSTSGITLATVDGGTVEDILISGASISQSRSPIFIRTGNRGRLMPNMPPAPIGKLRRVLIENVTGAGNDYHGSAIYGIPESPVTQVSLRNIVLSMASRPADWKVTRPLNRDPKSYPDAKSVARDGFDAMGFWIANTNSITFDKVSIYSGTTDPRPLYLKAETNSDILIDGRALEP
jgi:polygalacturonase